MRRHLNRFTILVILTAGAGGAHGGETDYYSRLRASVIMTLPGVQRITDQTLINTNNTTMKTRGCVFLLDQIAAGGPIGDIRLGMALDEIIHAWGNPPEAWWNYQGGPRLDYKGVTLYFASNKLSGVCLHSPELRHLRFQPDVPPRADIERWQQAIKPFTLNRTPSALQLQQATNQILLTLSFRYGSDSPLFQLRLEQSDNVLVSLPQRRLNRLGASYQPPRDKYEAAVLARLAALDQGFWWGQHKDPDPEQVTLVNHSGKSSWLVYFEAIVPAPDSGIFAEVDQKTGETEVRSE